MWTTRRGRWVPAWFAVVSGLISLVIGGWAQARDLATMNADEIKTLQQRLSDAGCYSGPIDGTASGPLENAIRVCPQQEPSLQIETGMHSASIWRISTDAACRIAVTGSDDKTVRLWSMPEGRLLRTQRLPIGSGMLGQFNDVAISRDGTLVASGGYDAFSAVNGKHGIYVFDAATGQTVRRFGSFDYAIQEIVFSPDGKLIAAGSLAGGVHVIDITTGQETIFDKGLAVPVEGLAFGPDGSLYAVSVDGFLRHYRANARPQKIATQGGRQPYSVSVDPTGSRIAVGFVDTPAVEEFDGHTLKQLGFADTSDLKKGHLSVVTWSGDGQTLFAAGFTGEDLPGQAVQRFIRRFNLDGTRTGSDVPVSLGSILGLASCGDGAVFASSEPSFGLLHAKGEATVLGRGHVADMRDKLGNAFQISQDGKQVRIGLGFGANDPILFDLRAGEIREAGQAAAGLLSPDITGLPVDGWLNSNSVKLRGRVILPAAGFTSRALAIRPDRTGFVLGISDEILSFDANGRQRWKAGIPEAWGVNLARNGDLIVSASGDGTVRWYRWSDGRELLALFVNRATRAWVAWTPTGYYMASPGGEDLIGWHVNRGWAQAADFFPASRFRDRFNRPDIVQLVLDTLDEDAAVKQANAKAHRRDDSTPLVAHLPPVIGIVDPAGGGRFATAEATFDYVWRSPSGLPVDAVEVLIDGRPVKEETLPVRSGDANAEIKGSLKVQLPPHDVEVGLIAYSGDSASAVARVRMTWTGAVAPKAAPRRLHALIVGVSDYASPDMALAYAAKDARDFGHALDGQKGGYYSQVETRVIVDRDVTRASLIDGLDWLASQAAGPDDVSVLFLSGHGLTDEKLMYWFLPSDATEEKAHSRGLSQDDVRRALRTVPGKVVWFLDTCHAGGAATRSPVDVNTLVNTVTSPENGGLITFASSKGNETSVESSVWKNGAFTLALVEGIEKGMAAARSDDAITISTLDAYLQARVSKLTDGAQHPNMLRPPQEPDFTFAQAKTSQ